MKDTTTHRRWGAIALGVITTAGAGAVLTADAVKTGPTIDHALAIVALVVTIAAGHLAVTEIRDWRPLRAAGLGLVFAGGVTFTLVSTAGRAIETQATAASTAVEINKARADKVADLDRARQRFEQANQMAEREMTGQKCLQRCQDWKLRATEVEAKVRILEVQLAGLGAERPVNAKLIGFARLVALVSGRDEASVLATLVVAWPYVLPLLIEFGAIVFWSIGLGRPSKTARTVRAITEREEPITETEIDDLKKIVRPSGNGGNKQQIALDDLLRMLDRGDTIPSQKALAERWNRPKQTVSDWLKEWEGDGLIPKRRTVGRSKALQSA